MARVGRQGQKKEKYSHMITPCLKGKAVTLQAWSGPEGFRKLRFPNGTGWW